MTATHAETSQHEHYPGHFQPPRSPLGQVLFGPGLVRGLWMGLLFFGLGRCSSSASAGGGAGSRSG